jgi:hypothetical protein
MNKINLFLFALLLFSGGNLFSQTAPPAVFAFPSGCSQATLNGTTFIIEVQLDGMPAENGADWVAVFNADEEVVGRAIVEVVLNNGNQVSGAQLVLRETQGSSGCSAVYTDGPVTVKLHDNSTGDVLLAANSIFNASNDSGEVNGPDGDGGLVDVFDFLAGALSVTLANLTATPHAGTVNLAWSTSSEIDNSHFDVERSFDPAAGFNVIGTVEGNLTTEIASNYAFADKYAGEGTVYYRLNQVDTDGTSTYSPIVAVELEVSDERSLGVFPNPASAGGRLTVRLNGQWTEGATKLHLVDLAGRQVAEWNGLGNGSVNTELPVMKTGVYQLVATDGKESRTMRVVIR